MLVFIARLTLTKVHLLVIRAIGAVVALWSISAIFAVAFQCGLPTPWDYRSSKCFSAVVFWNVIGSVDILIDVIMIIVPVWLVWTLQMSTSKKIVVIIAFAFRILYDSSLFFCQNLLIYHRVIGAAICRLIYLSILEDSPDPTFVDSVTYNVCTQCNATLAVIVACVPTLKPFMDRVESGLLNVSFHPRAPGTTYGPQDSYELKNMSKTSGNQNSSGSQSGSNRPWRPDMVGYKSVVSVPAKWIPTSKKERDAKSVESNNSEQMIIRQTTDWNVRYDNERTTSRSPV
jgi:hypothetical protein